MGRETTLADLWSYERLSLPVCRVVHSDLLAADRGEAAHRLPHVVLGRLRVRGADAQDLLSLQLGGEDAGVAAFDHAAGDARVEGVLRGLIHALGAVPEVDHGHLHGRDDLDEGLAPHLAEFIATTREFFGVEA